MTKTGTKTSNPKLNHLISPRQSYLWRSNVTVLNVEPQCCSSPLFPEAANEGNIFHGIINVVSEHPVDVAAL